MQMNEIYTRLASAYLFTLSRAGDLLVDSEDWHFDRALAVERFDVDKACKTWLSVANSRPGAL